jgi:hypothetical protein
MSAARTATQIKAFLAKYSPDIAAQLRAARTQLRALFPRGHELVYDNYNALVFGFSPTERSAQAFISIAGYPQWITLFFLRGVDLDDPDRLLEGSGKQVRGIRLGAQRKLRDPAVRALIEQAIEPHREALAAGPALKTIVKSISPKQRARRPAARATPRKKTAARR